jgi:phosphoenolpyruvate carboxykinase (ATP)
MQAPNNAIWNPSVETLIQACVESDACRLTETGAVVAYSGTYTGRTPKDKFIVEGDAAFNEAVWWENTNRMSAETFNHLRERFEAYGQSVQTYVIDAFAGADPENQLSVRLILERPYHALFIKQLLIRPTAEQLENFQPDWVITDFGKLLLDPEKDHTKGEAVIALNFAEREVLIAGTQYAGEIKKSVFSIMNFLLPEKGVLSMHCSANVGADGKSALFFGLSGTGKTTLSADPERGLIGDDEHGWGPKGIFNIEGGCYAKCIRLSAEGEPEIFNAIRRGAILENVVLDANGVPDYADGKLTENTRVAYPLEHIPNAVHPSVAGHPANVVFLTCDALGVLPPISRLTVEQAMDYFLNGYTSKLAGTEVGVTEPQVVFSTCFGQPFLPRHPQDYADLLGEKLAEHRPTVWLVNTGWTGGPVGVGERIKLKYTRAMLHSALSGELANVPFETEAVFGLAIPTQCENVPSELLNPRGTWSDPSEYDQRAQKLAARFEENVKEFTRAG